MSLEIRPEIPEDRDDVRRLVEAAFDGSQEEPLLVDLLRERNDAALALVAVEGGSVVGHIMFSPVQIQKAPEGIRPLGLAPLSVLPEFQNRGIGSALSRAGLAWCREHGCEIVVVLGEPGYYSRFGFRKAKDYNLDNEYGADDAFMVIELREGALAEVSGLVKYCSAFGDCAG